MSDQQTKIDGRGGKRSTSWVKGQSGNPKGGPVGQDRKDALAILKKAAPEIIQKALGMVLCDDPNVVIMTALIKKIFPDNLNLSGGENPLRIFLERYNAGPKV